MNLAFTVTQKELFEVLLNIAPVRPVFIWGAPGIGKSGTGGYRRACGSERARRYHTAAGRGSFTGGKRFPEGCANTYHHRWDDRR